MDIWKILERADRSFGGNVAIIDRDGRFTYRDLMMRSSALALALRDLGVRRGDRVAVVEVNSHEYAESYFAAAAMGVILTPVNHRLSAREIGYILRDSGARVILASTRFSEKIVSAVSMDGVEIKGEVWIGGDGAAEGRARGLEYESALGKHMGKRLKPTDVDESEVAHLYYTSGTTGEPKGVMLTHKNVCVHARCTIEELELAESDVWAHVAPMFHLADAWATFAITWVGGRHVMLERFEAGEALDAFERYRVTVTNLIPTMLNLMTRHSLATRRDLSGLRVILSGGAPIAREVVRRTMDLFGCDYIQTYGMTETSPFLTLGILHEHLKKLSFEERLDFKAKTGRPFLPIELKVVDEKGTPVAQDGKQVGEILVKGETVTPGYWNRPGETEQAFIDGWLRTGDLAVMDREGYVDIVDRKKDMIISGGENVYSTEVENVLYEHPDVLEAAVFGVPDPKWGEAVAAAVVRAEGSDVSAQDIIDFCRERLAGFKTPKKVAFMAELPRTGSGKISKRVLREPYLSDTRRMKTPSRP